MESFTLFCHFPVELQLAIWAFAVPDPEPEVCIVWPLGIEDIADEEPALPFIVDTAWPAIAHVCRTARQAVFASEAFRLRHSPTAGFAVPYRHFIPAIDTLYWGKHQFVAIPRFLLKPENASLARDLRYIAVEPSVIYPYDGLARVIRQGAICLRTLSFVLPSTVGSPSTLVSFLPPARRCRLSDISDESLSKIKVSDVLFLRDYEKTPTPLQEFLDMMREHMDDYVRRFAVLGDEGTAWNTREGCFSGLEIKAQTFVEYTMAENNQEQWVEVCKDRLLGRYEHEDDAAPEPRRIPVAKRKNPEEYRVLDDDSGWYSREEFELWMKQTNWTFDSEWYRNN